jgi:hypothetical protein
MFIKFLTLIYIFMISYSSVASFSSKNNNNNIELVLGVSTTAALNIDRNKGDDLSIEDIDSRIIGEKMFKVKKLLSEKYSLADNFTLGMYMLRYLSEIGTYNVPHEDIQAIIKNIESLTGEELDPDLKNILMQIEKIRFVKKNDGANSYVRIYTKNSDGIHIELNTDLSAPADKLKKIVITNKSKITFTDLGPLFTQSDLVNLISKPPKFLFFRMNGLFQVHPGIVSSINEFIQLQSTVLPLHLKFTGMYAKVSTKTIFKDMDFYLKEAVSLPGLKKNDEPMPNFVVMAKAKLLKVKISIDQ